MTLTKEEILDVVVEEANVERGVLVDGAQLSSLGIASLDVIGVSFILEDRYGVVMDPASVTPTSTVGDLVHSIQRLAEAKAST